MIGAYAGAVEAGTVEGPRLKNASPLEGRLGDHFATVDDLRSSYRELHADNGAC
jgi:hypothetical protein